ncbi:aminotransferase class I/II-fold pyridoxal phosphate-dependent enzyme [Emticicia sp. CRIBPO]|uniref:DegT/DnrJ/EryC1/StrS family aminotransferase n=1 Tax=Emticicia sp. CRIBPO TaxID=2683258 RepID=UPI001411EBD7|nr:DegT/DnrJ/EryC1/StrS family aminotransferase [Emticicia sp. CRIBPO]NBA87520.1 aminotransferase class I/II-fold pyridoxal phosphate-dependent enzyme [Emticicia sp. CRIBPO]
MRINVTQSFLPPIEEYQQYLLKIWDNKWLTNNGPLLLELEDKLKEYLNTENLLFVGNGTIALQIAIKAMELKGEIITTPFSYCATTTSILWENCQPVFVDINASDSNINVNLIEEAITEKTTAIMATHVYGLPCDVERIEEIANKYNLRVIYDAAHAFGVKYKNKSLLDYGDVSTCSFHATKVFHTIEGGCIISKDAALHEKMLLYRSFGHLGDEYFSVGINGKNSEFHAAMGLANLPHLSEIIEGRKQVFNGYDAQLDFDKMYRPRFESEDFEYNYAYYPVVLKDEATTLQVIEALNKENIYPRRYFYPSLNKLPYLTDQASCPVSEEISLKVISLPLHPELEPEVVTKVSEIINQYA